MIVKERGEECVRREMVVTGSEGEKGKVVKGMMGWREREGSERDDGVERKGR